MRYHIYIEKCTNHKYVHTKNFHLHPAPRLGNKTMAVCFLSSPSYDPPSHCGSCYGDLCQHRLVWTVCGVSTIGSCEAFSHLCPGFSPQYHVICRNSWIFWIRILCQIYALEVSFATLWLGFSPSRTLLIVSFDKYKFLISMWLNVSIFSSVALCFLYPI